MDVKVNQKGESIIFLVNGELDIATVEIFKKNLLLEECNQKEVLMDFEGVRFVDSTGIGGLIEVLRAFLNRKVDVQIYNIDVNVYEVFDILGLPELFQDVKFIEKKDN